MKITKIEKKKRLYLLELDDSERLYITEDTIVRFMLSKGMDVSQKKLKDIQDFAQLSYGKNLALYHLSFKQRTGKEVRDYLTKHEIDAATIPRVIDSLTADGWLDDRKYASSFIQSNLLSGDKGPHVLRQKLIQKGIDGSTIDEELDMVDFEELAGRVAEKLLRRHEGKFPPKALKDKIIQSLTIKGFTYNEAKKAFDKLDLEEDEASTQELLYKELDKQHRKYAKKYQDYELKQRLTQALARKGYDFSDIASALRDYL